MNIEKYWNAVLCQEAAAIRSCFADGAWINWHNTDEHFTVDEFIRANCEYPGAWEGEIERICRDGACVITAVAVWSKDGTQRFHVTSFIRIEDGKIQSIDEYWGDDAPAPQWRQEMGIGCAIPK